MNNNQVFFTTVPEEENNEYLDNDYLDKTYGLDNTKPVIQYVNYVPYQPNQVTYKPVGTEVITKSTPRIVEQKQNLSSASNELVNNFRKPVKLDGVTDYFLKKPEDAKPLKQSQALVPYKYQAKEETVQDETVVKPVQTFVPVQYQTDENIQNFKPVQTVVYQVPEQIGTSYRPFQQYMPVPVPVQYQHVDEFGQVYKQFQPIQPIQQIQQPVQYHHVDELGQLYKPPSTVQYQSPYALPAQATFINQQYQKPQPQYYFQPQSYMPPRSFSQTSYINPRVSLPDIRNQQYQPQQYQPQQIIYEEPYVQQMVQPVYNKNIIPYSNVIESNYELVSKNPKKNLIKIVKSY